MVKLGINFDDSAVILGMAVKFLAAVSILSLTLGNDVGYPRARD